MPPRSLPERDADGNLPIAGYAAIGNGRTIALVGCDGAIDWCCLPTFDSPFVLTRLLDARNGGSFTVRPVDPARAERRYVCGTNVLETSFETEHARGRLFDFMPSGADMLVRRMVVDEGTMLVEACMRAGAGTEPAFVDGDPNTLAVGLRGIRARAPSRWRRRERDHVSRTVLSSGEAAGWTFGMSEDAAEPSGTGALLEREIERWRAWSKRLVYDGRYRAAVERSALACKLLVHEPTGALVAAGTTSLPERIGGDRNWDYRFTWVRDSAWVLEAFMHLGMHDEAMRFWTFIERLSIGEGSALRTLYTVDGSAPPPERVVRGLGGYRGSSPVRIGNAAADQLQLDNYGHVLAAAHFCMDRMREPHDALRPVLRHLADTAASRWSETDRGVWEVRGPPRHYLHSKLMCWVALDRALRLFDRGWLDGDAERWRRTRTRIARALLQREPGTRDAFPQTLGGSELDAATLLVSDVGLLPGDHPRVRATIEAVQEWLARGDLVYRYTADDGLRGREGAFVTCSFWLARALAQAGRRDEARELFERVLGRANDVGLYSEEIDPDTGDFLGNFPQALPHLALVRTALVLDAGDASVAGRDRPRKVAESTRRSIPRP